MTDQTLQRQIATALQDTALQLTQWAGSRANSGPWSEEAYRTNVHVASALNILAAKLIDTEGGQS